MPGMFAKGLTATKTFFSTGIFAKRPLQSTGFRIHLAAYILVNALLIAINLLVTPDRLWFYWPLLGWGIGIVAHGTAEYFAGGRPSRASVRAQQRARRT